jgi:1-acyl-sn-glycerol-3-phosphate acyltransferase
MPRHIRYLAKSGPIFSALKKILRLFKLRPRIIGSENIPEKAVFISTHSGASGPFTLSLYFPKIFVPWGAYPMTQGYRSRWRYLYHVFYTKKLKYPKFSAWVLASLFAIISKRLYRGIHLIPSYPDIRIRKTLNESIAHLDAGNSILIFPEDSESGYLEVPMVFHAGFVQLVKEYHKVSEADIPVVPIYFSKKERLIMIGPGESILERLKHQDIREIADYFRMKIQAMSEEYQAEVK